MLSIVFPGVHRQGKSKRTGNDYDFWSFPYVALCKRFCQPDTYVAGDLNLNSRPDVVLPALCELTFDSQGGLENLQVVSSSPEDFLMLFPDYKPPETGGKSNSKGG